MNLIEIYQLAEEIGKQCPNPYEEKVKGIIPGKLSDPIKFSHLFFFLYWNLVAHKHLSGNQIIIYGAGKRAEENIEKIKLNFSPLIIWDAYSEKKQVGGIEVNRPFSLKFSKDTVIIVCIDNPATQREVFETALQNGYENVIPYQVIVSVSNISDLEECIRKYDCDQAVTWVKSIADSYRRINSADPTILFDYAPIDSKSKYQLLDNVDVQQVVSSLDEKLILNSEKRLAISIEIERLQNEYDAGLINIFEYLELLLRKVLTNQTKTFYRPIRMAGDDVFDEFSLYETLKIIFSLNRDENDDLKQFVISLMQICPDCAAIAAYHLFNLMQRKEYFEAKNFIKQIQIKYTNDLLISEESLKALIECKQNGVEISQSIPDYDLTPYFCWSGFSFAWCGGISPDTKKAIFGPCFRPLECAARPAGEFWTSEEWKLFRESLLDGSFRYCQKQNCPNIASKWLPRKDKISDQNILDICSGRHKVIPRLYELHLSYDEHCNLQCPSCRTEYKTISQQQVEVFDKTYQASIMPHVRTAKHLCLSGCGEALLSPHSKKILKSLDPASYPDLEVELRTNMTVLNPRTWEDLGNATKVIKHIAASIDAAKPETFEHLRYPAKWEVVKENLEFVSKLKLQGCIDVFEFHVVVQTANVNELVDIIKLAQKYHANVVTFSRILNWRAMSPEEYLDANPFFEDNPHHNELMQTIESIRQIQMEVEESGVPDDEKMFINMHGLEDPSKRYEVIRYGRYRIR